MTLHPHPLFIMLRRRCVRRDVARLTRQRLDSRPFAAPFMLLEHTRIHHASTVEKSVDRHAVTSISCPHITSCVGVAARQPPMCNSLALWFARYSRSVTADTQRGTWLQLVTTIAAVCVGVVEICIARHHAALSPLCTAAWSTAAAAVGRVIWGSCCGFDSYSILLKHRTIRFLLEHRVVRGSNGTQVFDTLCLGLGFGLGRVSRCRAKPHCDAAASRPTTGARRQQQPHAGGRNNKRKRQPRRRRAHAMRAAAASISHDIAPCAAIRVAILDI
jgi:hypothetical protein